MSCCRRPIRDLEVRKQVCANHVVRCIPRLDCVFSEEPVDGIPLSDGRITVFVERLRDDGELVSVVLGETREAPPHHVWAPDLEVVGQVAVSSKGVLPPILQGCLEVSRDAVELVAIRHTIEPVYQQLIRCVEIRHVALVAAQDHLGYPGEGLGDLGSA